jgi:hypothetical protein
MNLRGFRWDWVLGCCIPIFSLTNINARACACVCVCACVPPSDWGFRHLVHRCAGNGMTGRHVSYRVLGGAYLRNMGGRGRHERVGDRRGPGEDAGHVVMPLSVAGAAGYTHGRPPTPRLVTIVGRTGAADIVSIADVSINYDSLRVCVCVCLRACACVFVSLVMYPHMLGRQRG